MTPMTLDEYKKNILKMKKSENITPESENIKDKEVERFIELQSKPIAEEVKSEPQNMISESRTNSGPMSLDEFKKNELKMKKPENIIPYGTQTFNNFERISQPYNDSSNQNHYIHDDIPYRTPLKEEESLSNNDKQELYPHILKYLDDLAKKYSKANEMDNIIKNVRFEISKNDKKKEKAYNNLRIVFFALYKTKDKQDLIDHLRAEYLYIDRSEIDKLIEEIRAELKQYTGEELYKNWKQNSKDAEIEELLNILTKEDQKESSVFLTEKESEEHQIPIINKTAEKKEIILENQKGVPSNEKSVLIISNDLIDDKEREEINFITEKLFNSGIPTRKDYILFYFGEEIKLLDDNEIIKLAEEYETKFETLCVDLAEKMKNLIITEYGRIRDIKEIPLRSIFSFDLGTKIRKVIKRENVALSEEILNRVKDEINIYRSTQKPFLNEYYEEDYKRIFDFIDEHIKFSVYIKQKKTGKLKIIDPRFVNGKNELELRSWLIENLRHVFPRKFEIPLDNNLLSWFIFGDTPKYGEQSRVNARLMKSEIWKRFMLRDLLGIEYRVSKLTIQDFNTKGIKIDQIDLDILQNKVSYIIYYYIFFKEHNTPYVSNSTDSGREVGTEFWTPEYFLIKSVFFATAESNQGEIKDFKTIGDDSNVDKIQKWLRAGTGFGDSLIDISIYIENLYAHIPLNSDIGIFKLALRNLELYDIIYFLRYRALKASISSYDSIFEKDVHEFLLKICSLFIHHKIIVEAIGKRMISLNINNNKIIKRINYALHYDFYLKLDAKIRKYLGLDDKWKGIAVEANGIYWHNEGRETDVLKKAISKAENIILVEIWDNIDKSLWMKEIVRQINDQTHLDLKEKDILNLTNCY